MIRRVNFFCARQYRHREQASGGLAQLPSTLTYARYDHLVLALVCNEFLQSSRRRRAHDDEVARDAIQLRNRLIAHLEEADTECARAERPPLLTFVVAARFAGVETTARINDFLRERIPFYPNLNEDMLRVVLVHPGEYILPELGEKLGRYADNKLRARASRFAQRAKSQPSRRMKSS